MQDAGTEGSRRVQWYHPGEVVIVARVPRDAAASEPQMHADLHSRLLQHASDHITRDVSHMRSFVFDAPSRSIGLRRLAATDFDFATTISSAVVSQWLANAGTTQKLP